MFSADFCQQTLSSSPTQPCNLPSPPPSRLAPFMLVDESCSSDEQAEAEEHGENLHDDEASHSHSHSHSGPHLHLDRGSHSHSHSHSDSPPHSHSISHSSESISPRSEGFNYQAGRRSDETGYQVDEFEDEE